MEISLSSDVLNNIKGLETNKDNGIVLKVYINNSEIMYEGKMRAHELKKDREQLIYLSGYREYYKDDEGR